ncbi:hypothetical protein B0T18DRAFT_48578 [Schizothecium vesticola]|uniref:Uncharacterized protein n=1 Tax=Schizothecium vesticola TaxID=314040 RepID=A0AA40FBZ1_9PEZI|nr:hypothetical protein B0T18DRAFT_48578 [Schizothecium vesticola]
MHLPRSTSLVRGWVVVPNCPLVRLLQHAVVLTSRSTQLPPFTPRTAFGPLKGATNTTAFSAVKLVSDQDFRLFKTFHIINSLPPPAEVV